jgi:hypothetical protein
MRSAALVRLDEHDVEPGTHADLGNAGAHDAATDDPDAIHLVPHRKAWMPVSAPPTTSAWTSAVPS